MIFDKEYQDNWQAGLRGPDGKVEYKNFKIGYYKYPERVQFVEQTIIAILRAIPLACLIYICMNIGR